MRPSPPCPACGFARAARIVYGMPGFSIGLRRHLRRGDVVLGGLEASARGPDYRCRSCGHKWRAPGR